MNIKEIQQKLKPVFKQNDVIKSSVFGSTARGESLINSDIDILVQLPKNRTLIDFISLKNKIEIVLGKKIDLLTYKSISPLIKKNIQKDEIQIYG